MVCHDSFEDWYEQSLKACEGYQVRGPHETMQCTALHQNVNATGRNEQNVNGDNYGESHDEHNAISNDSTSDIEAGNDEEVDILERFPAADGCTQVDFINPTSVAAHECAIACSKADFTFITEHAIPEHKQKSFAARWKKPIAHSSH